MLVIVGQVSKYRYNNCTLYWCFFSHKLFIRSDLGSIEKTHLTTSPRIETHRYFIIVVGFVTVKYSADVQEMVTQGWNKSNTETREWVEQEFNCCGLFVLEHNCKLNSTEAPTTCYDKLVRTRSLYNFEKLSPIEQIAQPKKFRCFCEFSFAAFFIGLFGYIEL